MSHDGSTFPDPAPEGAPEARPTAGRATGDDARARFDAALVRLAQRALPPEPGDDPRDELEVTLAPVCEEVAAALGVDRVSVWRFDDEARSLHRIALVDRAAPGGEATATAIDAGDLPAYFAALLEARRLAAADALDDPRTRGLAAHYLEPLRIGALLDAPVRIGGRVRGVLCAEHRGGPRRWREDEEQFCAAAADLVAVRLQAAALRASESRFRALFECAPLAGLHVDAHGRILAANTAAGRLAGVDAQALVSRSLQALTHLDDLGEVTAALERVLTGSEECAALGARMRRLAAVPHAPGAPPAAPWRWCTVSISRVEQEFCPPSRRATREAIVFVEDIHERHEADVALRLSEERFRQLAEHIDEVFWIAAPGTREVLYVSPPFERVWGRPVASAYEGQAAWLDTVHPDDRAHVARSIPRQEQGGWAVEYRIVRPDGEVRWIRDRAFPVRDARGQVYRVAGLAEDVTGRRALEEQLRQAQKMDAIGRLAAGVAHDFNNILALISAGAQLALADVPPGHPAREEVEGVADAARRGAELTRQLLTLSRGVAQPSRALDLAAVVRDLEPMLRRSLGPEVEVRVEVARGVPMVQGDAAQVAQVLMNLAVNARDAMPGGGTLTIAVGSAQVRAGDPAWPAVRPGDYATLVVHDTGMGMDERTRSRVFEPFFTTKPAGRGTGLGLAVVWGIVSAADGHVQVDSAPGRGTRFTILWPRLT